MTPDTFQRAAIIALAWCLVGIGIDTGSDAHRAPAEVSQFATKQLPIKCQTASARNADFNHD
jgi:hypothetical protein